MRKKRKNLVFGLVYVLIISGIIGYFSYLGLMSTQLSKKYPSYGILIFSDSDFLKYDLPGSGTQTDPYIIENYSILTSEHSAIQIERVTKYVIIRNNYLRSRVSALEIEDSVGSRIKIINNTCVGSVYPTADDYCGIYIYNSDGCFIYNNTFLNLDTGIDLHVSDNCSIIHNHFENQRINIIIVGSRKVNIENNSLILYEQVEGPYYHESLYIFNSKNISIKKNTIENGGLIFHETNASSLIVQDNLVNGFELGYFIDETYLEINSSTLFGQLFFINCNNSIIRNQEIRTTNEGISLINCLNFNISFCNFSDNHFGVSASYSNNINLVNNTFMSNMFGIYLHNSNCTYNQNNFYNNTYNVYTS